jgi:hypothetical protein
MADTIAHHNGAVILFLQGLNNRGIGRIRLDQNPVDFMKKGTAGCQPADASNDHVFRLSTGWQPVVRRKRYSRLPAW